MILSSTRSSSICFIILNLYTKILRIMVIKNLSYCWIPSQRQLNYYFKTKLCKLIVCCDNLEIHFIFHFQMFIFWVTDNFLMYKKPSKHRRRDSAEQSLLHKAKVKYRSFRRKKSRTEPESDVLLSGDDELLDPEYVPITKAIVTWNSVLK